VYGQRLLTGRRTSRRLFSLFWSIVSRKAFFPEKFFKNSENDINMDLLGDILSSMDKNKRPVLIQADKALQSEF
jgi:hypothetical protein